MGVACCHECRCPGRKRVPSGPDGSHLRQDDAQIGAGGVRWVGVLSRTQRYRRSTTCAMTSLAATGAHHPTGPLTAAPSTIPRHTTTSSHAAVPTSSPPSWASAPASRASETRFVVPRPPITLTVATQQWSFLRDTRPGPCEFGGRIDASQIRHGRKHRGASLRRLTARIGKSTGCLLAAELGRSRALRLCTPSRCG